MGYVTVELGLIYSNTSQVSQVIRTVQCESYEKEGSGVTFYRVRFIDELSNPNEYFASYYIPSQRIIFLYQKFKTGDMIPNYGPY